MPPSLMPINGTSHSCHTSCVKEAVLSEQYGGVSFFDWISLCVGALGFAVTIWQLFRTANASVATRKAVERTEKHMASSYLLVLLPQFRIVESDLDSAVLENDRRLAMRALRTYSDVASEVRTLLGSQAGIDEKLLNLLESTSRSAALAKAELINSPNRQIKSVTKVIRDELAHVSTHVGGLTAKFSLGGTNA